MLRSDSTKAAIKRFKLTVRGIVQGVGFRPFVFNLAKDCGLTGSVFNNGDGVEIDIQGERTWEFISRLPAEAGREALAKVGNVICVKRSRDCHVALVCLDAPRNDPSSPYGLRRGKQSKGPRRALMF